jgi:DNA-binding GntR family transcriptional regulator
MGAALGELQAAEPRAKLMNMAYETLEEAIVTLKLPPGCVVSEQQLADMTGIGRTPIREAVQRLAREQLMVVLPQRGLLVSSMDVNKQLKLLETRREIERLICRSAARRANVEERKRFRELADDFRKAASRNDDVAFMRADRDFNESCLVASRNEFSERAMRMLQGLSRRVWFFHYKRSPDMPGMAQLHADVALAIANGDVNAAGQALDRLIDNIEGYTRATVLSER